VIEQWIREHVTGPGKSQAKLLTAFSLQRGVGCGRRPSPTATRFSYLADVFRAGPIDASRPRLAACTDILCNVLFGSPTKRMAKPALAFKIAVAAGHVINDAVITRRSNSARHVI
jgi:hypothetical protein